jgi:hypothetical protein
MLHDIRPKTIQILINLLFWLASCLLESYPSSNEAGYYDEQNNLVSGLHIEQDTENNNELLFDRKSSEFPKSKFSHDVAPSAGTGLMPMREIFLMEYFSQRCPRKLEI